MENIGKCSIWLIVINMLMMIPCYCFVLMNALNCGIGLKFVVRCKIPPLEDVGWSFWEIKTLSQPRDGTDYCNYYTYNYDQMATLGYSKSMGIAREETIASCNDFVFKRDKYYTMYEEFSLICQHKYIADVIQIAPMYGILLGCILIVPLADLYGRKRTLMWGQSLFFICGIIIPIIPTTTTLILARILSGIAYYAMYVPIQALVVELSNNTQRAYGFIIIQFGIAFGYITLPFIAIPITHWRLLQIVASSFLLLLPLLTWYVPESPLWWFSRTRKTTRAWDILKSVKDPVAQSELQLRYMNETPLEKCVDVNLVRNKNFALISGLFVVVGITYFKNYPGKLSTDWKLNSSLFLVASGASECLSCCMSICCLFFFRRRFAIMIFFVISALAFFPFAIVKTGTWESLVLFMLLEATTSAAYVITALYAAEKIPPSHRCRGLGLLHGAMALSTIITFYLYHHISANVLLSIMGSASLVGIVIAYCTEDNIITQNLLRLSKMFN